MRAVPSTTAAILRRPVFAISRLEDLPLEAVRRRARNSLDPLLAEHLGQRLHLNREEVEVFVVNGSPIGADDAKLWRLLGR
jgi:hypothetical protein